MIGIVAAGVEKHRALRMDAVWLGVADADRDQPPMADQLLLERFACVCANDGAAIAASRTSDDKQAATPRAFFLIIRAPFDSAPCATKVRGIIGCNAALAPEPYEPILDEPRRSDVPELAFVGAAAFAIVARLGAVGASLRVDRARTQRGKSMRLLRFAVALIALGGESGAVGVDADEPRPAHPR